MKGLYLLSFLFVVLISSCVEHKTNEDRFATGKWVDLTHAYDEQTPYWPTADGFEFDTVFAGMTEGGWYYTAFEFSSAEHGGTHIDAPVHFAEGKKTVDEIEVDRLIGEAVVLDVSDSCRGYIDYQVTVEDFERWEARHGRIPDGSIVLIYTGISEFWPDRMRYMGTDRRGPAAVALLHFPGLHPDAAEWLVQNRSINAIGLDTPSIDYGRSSDFMSHRILMAENIPAFENVARLEELPPKGAYVMAMPMKIKGGSGGPLRIVAHVPDVK